MWSERLVVAENELILCSLRIVVWQSAVGAVDLSEMGAEINLTEVALAVHTVATGSGARKVAIVVNGAPVFDPVF